MFSDEFANFKSKQFKNTLGFSLLLTTVNMPSQQATDSVAISGYFANIIFSTFISF